MLRLSFVLGAGLAFVLSGCTPNIGDSCVQSTDCSQLGDRLCDPTQPGGYCTIFNCEPDTCPESICVAFQASLDPACGSEADSRNGRFLRQFCMKPCETTSDCRDGYVCLAPSRENRLSRIVDEAAIGSKVCMADTTLPKPRTSDLDGGADPQVCSKGDAGPPWTPYDGGTGASGGGGSH